MNIPENIRTMLGTLHENGYSAYLVGGCVRDALMGLTPHDYDIATDALPEEIISLFGEAHCTYYGKAFGTVCVHRDGGEAEITTFRTEGDYADSRHPGTVSFAKDVHDDLSRRDFTCNAIAYDPRTGLLDPFHGEEDLKNGILRAVGVPSARFREDALRILRGMRFYSRFGLKPEPLTEAAMRAAAYRLQYISVERVFQELCGMLTGEHITEVLLAYPHELAVWIPEILPCIGFEQRCRWHDFTVWEHIARAVGNIPPVISLRLTMLLHDIAKPQCCKVDARGMHFKGHAERSAVMADKILRRLRCGTALREQVCRLIYWHRDTPRDMPQLRRLLGMMGEEELRMFFLVLDADRLSKWEGCAEERVKIDFAEALLEQCLADDLCCTVRQLAAGGKEAAEAGLQGQEIGHALQAALDAVIDEEIPNEKEALSAFFRTFHEK